jgi:phosphatidylserine/phosphatidylglycerophosphate/cardiolipin synthase-like enzyme
LKVVGYYSSRDKKNYAAFLLGLAATTCPKCVNVKAFRMPGDRWHAKVFIAKKGNTPVVVAIGSSNITRRAFDTYKSFNYECDVLFWDENNSDINTAMLNILGEQPEEFPSVMVATYDETYPTNKVPLQNRLITLENEIMSKVVPFSP